jgi:hypothetical protein
MAKVIAKGKKRRERLEAEAEAIKEFEDTAVVSAIKAEKREKQNVQSDEIVNVVKETFNRLFAEFHPSMGSQEREAYADDRARQVLRVIKHGIPEPGHGARIIDEEQRIPLCRECR